MLSAAKGLDSSMPLMCRQKQALRILMRVNIYVYRNCSIFEVWIALHTDSIILCIRAQLLSGTILSVPLPSVGMTHK